MGWLPKKSLKGEHVFVTGAGSGLGRYMSIQFAKMGCKLSLSDVNMQMLEDTSKFNLSQYFKEPDSSLSSEFHLKKAKREKNS